MASSPLEVCSSVARTVRYCLCNPLVWDRDGENGMAPGNMVGRVTGEFTAYITSDTDDLGRQTVD